MTQYQGSSQQDEIKVTRRRKDTRLFRQKWADFFNSDDGSVMFCFLMPIVAFGLIKVPLGGELMILILWWFYHRSIKIEGRHFNFPYRVPFMADAGDSSMPKGKKGEGITLLGNETGTRQQIYIGNSDLRTHQLVLGTTGSGKTEYLLGLVFNAIIQNTGYIYVDGKGDPKLQKEVFRLARYLGREDDLLIINFITSGRDFVNKQPDKVTNNMNMMGNTSSGMLIELIVALMDDSGGGGDMWKGRAISFVAALTRPLCYLRDMGYINLSPDKFLDYFELPELEEMVFNHNGKYGSNFDVIVAPLRSYLLTLPGYQKTKLKKQETKTLEQHGFIVMQLTRIFNDLNFNYGHIFKTQVGDVDFYDVVINRRILTVLLPALERAPDSMRMLGKMIVGSIKQMMAGCLGNRVEGVVREIIDSRPTNSKYPFYCVLDEYGYYSVVGFAVAPAQARSLGFSITFAAQDFSSLKKSSAEEADATWENTNMRVVGRMTSGSESESWRRINGAAGESTVSAMSGFQREVGALNEKFYQQDNVGMETKSRINYNDLALQENGEFHFIIGKKSEAGQTGGVRVIRGMGFYTASKSPKDMRINDFVPVIPPEPNELPKNLEALNKFLDALASGEFVKSLASIAESDPILLSFKRIFNANETLAANRRLRRTEIAKAAMSWFCNEQVGIEALDKIDGIKTDDTSPKPLAAVEVPPLQMAHGADAALPDGIEAAIGGMQASPPSAPQATTSVDVAKTMAEPVQTVAAPSEAVKNALLAGAEAINTAHADIAPTDVKTFSYTDDDVNYDADMSDDIVLEALDNSIVGTKDTAKVITAFSQITTGEKVDNIRSALGRVIVSDGHSTQDEIRDTIALPDVESLYSVDLLANPGINNLATKYATLKSIETLSENLNDSTRYIDKPIPEKIDIAAGASIVNDIKAFMDDKWQKDDHVE